MRINPVRTALLVSALVLGGCASMTKEEYLAEVDRLDSLNCQSLDVELILAETSKQVQIIRQVQAEKGCEIRPVMARGLKKKREMREMPEWRTMRKHYRGMKQSRPEG